MKNLLVSFSGGETSAFMAQWLNKHYERFGYENIVFYYGVCDGEYFETEEEAKSEARKKLNPQTRKTK